MPHATRIMPDGKLENHIIELLGLAVPESARRKLEDIIAELHELREPILKESRGRDPHAVPRMDPRATLLPDHELDKHLAELCSLDIPPAARHKLECIILELIELRDLYIEPPRRSERIAVLASCSGRTIPNRTLTLADAPPSSQSASTRSGPGPVSKRKRPRTCSLPSRSLIPLAASTSPAVATNSVVASQKLSSRFAGDLEPSRERSPAQASRQTRPRAVKPPSDHLPKGFDAVTPEQRALYEGNIVPGIPPIVRFEDFVCSPSHTADRIRFFNGQLYVTFNVCVTLPGENRESIWFHPDNFLVQVLLPSRSAVDPTPRSVVWWRGRVHVEQDQVRVTYDAPKRRLPELAEQELLKIWHVRGKELSPVGSVWESLQHCSSAGLEPPE